MSGLQGKKIYFPVESLVGLGHFNRTGRLVREMTAAGASVTVASGTFVDKNRFFPATRCIEIPSPVLRFNNDKYYTLESDGRRTLVENFNDAAHTNLRQSWHVKWINRIAPDVLCSEFWPFDRPQFDQEMNGMIRATADRPCLRVVSVRDIIHEDVGADASSDARAAWAAQTLNDHFDAVLVHGDPRLVRLEETFAAAADLRVPVIYTGYVLADLPLRRAPDAQTGPILVSCGSGVGGHDMLFSFMAAWENLLRRAETDSAAAFATERPLHIITGPRFLPHLYDEAEQWARRLGAQSGHLVTLERYRQDFTDVLAQAAFSVSLAGYNTTLETLALGVPGILVPKYQLNDGRIASTEEQENRLRRLQQAGMAVTADPHAIGNARQFADMIAREMTAQLAAPRAAAVLDMDGAGAAVRALEMLAVNKFDTRAGARYG